MIAEPRRRWHRGHRRAGRHRAAGELQRACVTRSQVVKYRARGFRAFVKIAPVYAKPIRRSFRVRSLEGVMRGRTGGYLCVGPDDEQWVVRREIFEATYRLTREARTPSSSS